ncbi:3-methyl-2-oxobutanoate hydroxymethyltransferase [Sugiyamaella lignohabitans]|uniref:3-methyl-2-oxobutanoate hydroxymethyltransferase n=1 Tax=Sugiyamaella lignohabitans TaxID=796027 RepID=A0A167F564_9ASCO|nr:3-methyl-2-oxobutanoate hydroxymethyltransferase [Sugiyamaella lignohabitans]ANB14842.1 3-methyl-2-oxobutanoate hydroxymethyltransferase [Sugiyamaella lignohabitans]
MLSRSAFLHGHSAVRAATARTASQLSTNGTRTSFQNIFVQSRNSHYNSKSDDVNARPPVTIPQLRKLYKNKTPISMITAHDYISGMLADRAGVDMVLVGDSLAMVSMGHESTSEIDLNDMVYHTRAVSRGVKSSFLIADLPFGSYETSPEQAFDSAVKMIKKGNAQAVKIEGGKELYPTIKKLTDFGIPVVGHIGLTPQRQNALGGFRVQGKTAKSAVELLENALAIQEAGCFIMIIEAVPDKVGSLITEKLSVPTIGIGAGPGTSGQVLVQLDMLGGFDAFVPKFLKRYSNYLETNVNAIKTYSDEVKSHQFPSTEHTYSITDDEFAKFQDLVAKKGY